MIIKLAILLAIVLIVAAFAAWAFLPARYLPGNRARHLRIRLHLRVRPRAFVTETIACIYLSSSTRQRCERGRVQYQYRSRCDRPPPNCASGCHAALGISFACGATASTPAGQIVQPWAESAAHCWLAQCLHRYSSPRRSMRYAARTAGPHRSHASFMSASAFLAE
jgi:hypothetical protein